MNTLQCKGLDGSNPLHFLAALGVLRLVAKRQVEPLMSWKWQGTWNPFFFSDMREADFSEFVSATLFSLAKAEEDSIGKEISGLQEELKKLKAKKRKEGIEKGLKRKELSAYFSSDRAVLEIIKAIGEAKKQKCGPTSKEIAGLQDELKKLKADKEKEGIKQGLKRKELSAYLSNDCSVRDRQRKLNELQEQKKKALDLHAVQLGAGIAHLGDKIGVPIDTARRCFVQCVQEMLNSGHGSLSRSNRFIADHCASLCSDAVSLKGNVIPSPFSFSNGQGGQLLLKNFRDMASSISADNVKAWLNGTPCFSLDATSLNWEPSNRNDYALSWADPGKPINKKPVDTVTNALAYIGLGMLTSVPLSTGRLGAVGWTDEMDEGFVWPIWSMPIGPDIVACLLSHIHGAMRSRDLKQRGIESLFYSKCIKVGEPPATRFYFSPSRPL